MARNKAIKFNLSLTFCLIEFSRRGVITKMDSLPIIRMGKVGGFFGGGEYYVVLKGNRRDQSSPTKYKGGTVQK